MAGEVMSRELLEELEASGRDPKRGLVQRLFGQKRSQGVEDLNAYRLGRNGSPIKAGFLSARLRQYDDKISSWVLTLLARRDELDRQSRDLIAWTGHTLAMLVGFAILAAALTVDYMIIHEFWTRVLANEFGEVPPALASSVVFKSAQVVFATLAFHLMLETVGETGRRIFILFIFALTFCMLLGIGIIIANNWLPAGSQLFGISLDNAPVSGDDILAALGLGGAATSGAVETGAAAASGGLTEGDVRTAQTLLWLASLSVIFIIVTGVGSLCMRFGIRGFLGIFGDLTFDTRHGGAARLGFRKDELVRVKNALAYFQSPKSRWRVLQKHLSDFVTSYYEGVRRYEQAWGGIGRAVFKRDERAVRLLKDLEQAVLTVESEWTLDYVRHRHALDTYEPATDVDPDERRRQGPSFDDDDDLGDFDNVFKFGRKSGTKSGTDE